jgi:uncharacterized Zn finger protein
MPLTLNERPHRDASLPLEMQCPKCETGAINVLPFSATAAWVWYVRCAACGHVWTLPKAIAQSAPAPLLEF